jgi:hypothetical protein
MKKKIIDLEIVDELEESGVSQIALVDVPAIEKYWMAFKREEFIEPNAGESEEDFLNRCIPAMLEEGKEQDQAVAMCYSMYESMSYDTSALPTYVDEIPNKKKEKFEGFIDYPQAASDNAKRALDWAEKNGWGSCGTPIGKMRANQLARRERISEETVARMASFERHRMNSRTPYDEGCGKLMWDAWGGTEGIEWAQRKLRQIRNESRFEMAEENMDVFGYPTRYFYICPGAIATFTHLLEMNLTDEDVVGMIRSAAVIADRVFQIEQEVLDAEKATEAQLKEAVLLVDDFKDIFEEIDEIVGMVHDISYMDGHILTISEYYNPEQNVDLSAALDYFRSIDGLKSEDLDFHGMEVEKDYEGIDLEFAAGYTVYRYEGEVGADTRDFCREMVTDGRFFTFQEIVGFNSSNPGFGPGGSDEYSIFHYKGGPNCKHHWQKYYVNSKGLRENKGPAPGKAGTEPIDMPNQGYMMAADPITRIPKEERGREGSAKNKEGDTKTSRGGIEVSQEVEKTLKDKIEEHNKKNTQESQKADLGMLKAVWRRGAGAYSVGTPGRRGMTRSQWAMGRVNAFLKILGGSAPSDKDYTQDNDLLPKGHPKHSEQKMCKLLFASEDQQILVGPVAIPDMEIVRKDKDTGEIYYVKFSKKVVQRMAEKFMKELRNDQTNIQHNPEDEAGSYIMETWLVENPEDKANSVYNLDVPVGSWVVKMRVTDPETWQLVKAGELRGFSLEGNFMDRKDWEAYQKDREVYNKIIKILKNS